MREKCRYRFAHELAIRSPIYEFMTGELWSSLAHTHTQKLFSLRTVARGHDDDDVDDAGSDSLRTQNKQTREIHADKRRKCIVFSTLDARLKTLYNACVHRFYGRINILYSFGSTRFTGGRKKTQKRQRKMFTISIFAIFSGKTGEATHLIICP